MPHDDDRPQEGKGWPKPGEDGERLERLVRKDAEDEVLARRLKDVKRQ